MSEGNRSLRIDWFDGTIIEDTRQNVSSSSSQFADEESLQPQSQPKSQYSEKKTIGYRKLLDISYMNPSILTLELSHKASFWNLMNTELKGDFIVLIVKILLKLYKYLEPGEKSLMKTVLKTKFENSKFIKTLKEYLIGLPSVRIAGKRMNLQLWDDIESFYFEIISLCKNIYQNESDTQFLKEVYDLLEITETSAYGVKEEHTERFSDDLFAQIVELKRKILKVLNKETTDIVPQNQVQTTDMNNFKNLKIFPTKEDLFGINRIKLEPNIANGAYPSVEHYLDLQFKLLREDCFGPLREGICKYMENPSKRRYENIRVYPRVRIIRTYITNNKVGHLVDIAWKERVNHGLIDSKKYNKQLMFGSLLLFSSDNFETILCATVLDSNLSLLSEGYVAVIFQNTMSKKIFAEPYVMIESEVFFEPYHRVLKVLQNSKLDYLPMQKYIVDVETKTEPPAYLSPDTMYSISQPNKHDITFPVLETSEWPSNEQFSLDEPQMEAFKHALTKEFSVIQGPPGTGKTHIGVKIASIILKNLSLEGTPMLIICYTNHALDQFLEGILNVTKNVVRLGSQSKSKILEPYTLNNMRARVKSRYGYLYATKRTELEGIYKEMSDLQSEIEKCEKEILCYRSIKPHLKFGDRIYELKTCKEDSILYWLFNHLEDEQENFTEDELEDWEKQLDDIELSDGNLESCFSEQWALKEIESMKNSIKYVKDVTDDEVEGQIMKEKFEAQINKVKKRLNYFKKHISLVQREEILDVDLEKNKDLYDLRPEQRWKVYCSAVKTIREKLMNKMNELLSNYSRCSDELEEVSSVLDGEVARAARAVAVTTSAAARRHDLMKKLLSPIVIVEEAAEVLEAHIVTSLTQSCQHLILIGDHKQLRPTAAHYKLAKDYNLEISLFERMIRNGVHARTLTTQRRMRPSFVDLLVPTIYEKLDCHPSVYNYPNVRGMTDNLYFFSHDAMEDSEATEDSWSHRNNYEAKWCVALANYLRHMNYKCDEITILSTYTGQATLIKEISKKYSLLRDIKITVVDNYQGEENRIVILSLVRSNRDGKIGFLAAQNRICVALSRAKEGLYIFGNMSVLKSSSRIWRLLEDKLMAQRAIGKKLGLKCERHPENTLDVDCVENLGNCLSGSCLKSCKSK